MTQRYFITGTDTECGKTWTTVKLAARYITNHQTVSCFKPLASGADITSDGLRNDDALQLQACASQQRPYQQVNPYCFAPAIAPHIAAQQAKVTIDLDTIVTPILAADTDITLIEGFGGWLAPVDMQTETILWQADIAREVNAEVILVVGMKLGCLNHAQLSINQIKQDGLNIAGWIANPIDPHMPVYAENLATLEALLEVPRLLRN